MDICTPIMKKAALCCTGSLFGSELSGIQHRLSDVEAWQDGSQFNQACEQQHNP